MINAAGILSMLHDLPVFPCDPSTKRPLTPHGFKDASSNDEDHKKWFTKYPNAMIGLPTGQLTSLFVIDLDKKPEKGIDGANELEKLEVKHGRLPKTATQKTPSGGRHLFFKMPPGRHIKSTTNTLGPGIDIRADGGYVVIAPSVNARQGVLRNVALKASAHGGYMVMKLHHPCDAM
jgi:putative DNA primase/helicase